MRTLSRRDRVRGCLLGGALGDALGWPVEFCSLDEIRRDHGPDGITGLLPGRYGLAEITDDTQMTLFTVAGLCAGGELVPSLYAAYLDWLGTQNALPPGLAARALGHPMARYPGLMERRAPGTTCLSALASGRCGTVQHPVNDSAGCGGVMRAAPVGLRFTQTEIGQVFAAGCASAAITHGNPRGYLPAGMLAAMVWRLCRGGDLRGAAAEALDLCRAWPGSERPVELVSRALTKPATQSGDIETAGLGAGWVGDEALAIALASCLGAPGDPARALCIAVNHSGDSDSTGSIAGNLLGCQLGEGALPAPWLERLELSGLIRQVADSL